MTTPARPLAGRSVATTRDRPGRLDELLARLGADVVHVPLIEIADPPEPLDELSLLDEVDWVVVTSQHGAARVAAAVSSHPLVRTAAVGTRTAQVLEAVTGRRVTVVPDRQTAADLVDAMPDPDPDARRVLVAQADRAEPTLVDGLRARGFDVRPVVAYVTRLRVPSDDERAALSSVDAVAFASGSAARAWAEVIGTWTPPLVVTIGPSTTRVARQLGLQISLEAADHSVEGLANAVTDAFRTLP